MKIKDIPADARELSLLARAAMDRLCAARKTIATAETCTGGLIASLLTDLPGSATAFACGFVACDEQAKCDLLGIDPVLIVRHGVVSREIARAMADGALARSRADIALAVTGYAGPGGKGDEPGLVQLAVRQRGGRMIARECHYGDVGRDRVRMLATLAALEMIEEVLDDGATGSVPAGAQTGDAADTT